MKARLLKKLLNNTKYSISNHEDYIAVGSPLCHDLFKVDKKTLKVKYALDTWNNGRKELEGKSNEELLFIWDKLHELIETEQIKDIIEGKDVIKKPLPVFTVTKGKLVESITDEYGWPNTDDNGICMYENTHFKTKIKALRHGVQEEEYMVKHISENIEERKADLNKRLNDLNFYKDRLNDLKYELDITLKK